MKKNKKLVVVGASPNSRLARLYFDTDSEYEVVAFAVNRAYLNSDSFEGLPLVAFEEVSEKYPPGEFDMFVAIGYNKMNKVRENLYNQSKEMGYRLPSYISSRCSYLSQFPPGDNCLILEDNTVQPYVKIGNNVVLWSGNHIGHDAVIEDHCYVTSHVVISGFTVIKNNCFLGVNCTLRDAITIAPESLIGAGAVIMRDTVEQGVYLAPRSVQFDKKSNEIQI